MNIVKSKLAKIMAVSLLAGAGVMFPVQMSMAAVSGTTAVTVNAPDIIILHYYSALTLDFAALNEALDEGTPTLGTPALAANVSFAGGLTATVNSTYETAGVMTVTVTDAWGVRALTNLGNVTVTGVLDTAAATNTAASTVTLGALEIGDSTSTTYNAGATGIQFVAPGMAKAGAYIGDVRFTLDISGATLPGAHTGAQYTLTATAT